MATLASLWLPILLSAVFVFIASSIIHMVFRYHRADVRPLPNEGAVEGVRDVAPGVYVFPYSASMKEMGSPAMAEKYRRGPVGILTLLPARAPRMGKGMVQWFVFSFVVSVFVAYVCSRTLTAGVTYLHVFRVAGVVAFLGYVGSEATHSIWAGQPWSNTLRHYFDGLVYALVTAGVFAWLWPWRLP